MAVSGIQNATSPYDALSSGKQINSAADDAAGLSIVNKLESQSTGHTAGTKNAESGIDLIKTADSALGSITDYLQGIRELSLKASNPMYGSEELSAIQSEIDQMKQGIQDVAKNTSFNTLSLLDGSMADLDLATNPDGTGSSIQLYNSTLETLGIADYDVTGSFDLQAIDEAINQVNESRSSLGSTSNALDSTINSNNMAAFNTTGASSRMEDADMYQQISELNKNKVLEEYRMFAQNARTEQEKQSNLVAKMFQ